MKGRLNMKMTRWLMVGLTLALAPAALAAGPVNNYVAGDLGISIEVPVSTDAQGDSYQVAAFLLPPSDGFSANVNVQKQRFGDSLEAYDKLSTAQFREFKFAVVKTARKGNQVTWEYMGDLQGRKLHWYARAIKSGDYVYLATGTVLESRWDKQKAAIIRSVESFTVK